MKYSVCLLVVLPLSMWAQSTPFRVARPPSTVPPVLNAPYSVDLERTTTPANRGASTHTTDKAFRDAQGRVRLEDHLRRPDGERLLIVLTDPHAGRECFLDTQYKVAHCFLSIPVVPAAKTANPQTEDLGSKIIEGLRAEGKRSPAGEIWTATDLGITVESKTNSRNGVEEMHVHNIRRTEPDASLFQIPADYSTVKEACATAELFVPAPASPAPCSTSGGITVSQPKLITRVAPGYTEEARRAKIEGIVRLQGIVREDGKAHELKIVKPLDPGLDQKAVEAVTQWVFEPGQKDGKPVPVLATFEVNFKLIDKK